MVKCPMCGKTVIDISAHLVDDDKCRERTLALMKVITNWLALCLEEIVSWMKNDFMPFYETYLKEAINARKEFDKASQKQTGI